MTPTHSPRRVLRSAGAVLAGLLVIMILSIATDVAMYATGIFPARGQPLSDSLWLIPTGYRLALGVLGCWLAARLAPRRPFEHALALGGIGFLLGMVGLILNLNAAPPLGPTWYAVAVMVMTMPAAILGGWFGGGVGALDRA
ncbi:MAG: hypothetical protein AB7Q17_04020 [Phycisphaerae bacterium]